MAVSTIGMRYIAEWSPAALNSSAITVAPAACMALVAMRSLIVPTITGPNAAQIKAVEAQAAD